MGFEAVGSDKSLQVQEEESKKSNRKEYLEKWRKENKDKWNDYLRQYRKNHHDRILNYYRKYRKQHREKIRLRNKERSKEKLEEIMREKGYSPEVIEAFVYGSGVE